MIPSVYPIVGLLVLLAVLAAVLLAPCLRAFRNGWFAAAAVAAVLYAGTKPNWTVSFNLGLHDASSVIDTAEGVVIAKWTWDAPVAGHTFRWSYSVNGGDYVQLPDAKVSDGTATAVIPATPDDQVKIMCYALYVPPVIVRTNGVYHLDGVMRTMGPTNAASPSFVTPPIYIYADLSEPVVIAPPTNKPPTPVSARISPNSTEENDR